MEKIKNYLLSKGFSTFQKENYLSGFSGGEKGVLIIENLLIIGENKKTIIKEWLEAKTIKNYKGELEKKLKEGIKEIEKTNFSEKEKQLIINSWKKTFDAIMIHWDKYQKDIEKIVEAGFEVKKIEWSFDGIILKNFFSKIRISFFYDYILENKIGEKRFKYLDDLINELKK